MRLSTMHQSPRFLVPGWPISESLQGVCSPLWHVSAAVPCCISVCCSQGRQIDGLRMAFALFLPSLSAFHSVDSFGRIDV